jgi:hypothetical protein
VLTELLHYVKRFDVLVGECVICQSGEHQFHLVNVSVFEVQHEFEQLLLPQQTVLTYSHPHRFEDLEGDLELLLEQST